MKILSLFAGIGGIDIGLEKLGWSTVAYSEFDPKLKRQYAAEIMAARFPDAVQVGDITTLVFARNKAGVQGILRPERICGEDNAEITYYDPLFKGDIDVVCGGFPCQNVSLAGKGGGVKDGDRSGLWRNYAQAIEGLKPRGVLIENVAALASRGLDIVLNDLARIGYDAEWDVISAAGVGAPHLRERLLIIAWPSGTAMHAPWPEPPCYSSWRTEPEGIPRITMENIDQRVARLRCLGNAVVPQVAHHVGKILQSRIRTDMIRPTEHDHSGDALHKSGEFKGKAKYIGEAGPVLGTILDMKLPRAGRLTSGRVYERERTCTQKFAKARALAKMAPTLRPQHPSAPPLMPTPAVGQHNGSEAPDQWLERRERLKESSNAGNGAGMPLAVASKLLPTATAMDAASSRNASAIRSPGSRPANSGETLTDYVDPTNGGRLLPTAKASDGDKGVRSQEGAAREMARGKGGDLDAAVKMIPTPRASEWKGVGPIDSKSQAYRLDKGYLDATMQDIEQRTGRLNPDWVEFLMGFQQGWTTL